MLTDAEIIELEKLEREEEVYQRIERLKHPDDNSPKNYRFLHECYTQQRYEGEKLVSGKKGVVLEGSARSRKTFSVIDFLIFICLFGKRRYVITIIRETYTEFKTTLYNEWRAALNEYDLDNPFERLKEIDSFKINGSQINFIGADQEKKLHGLTSDFIYYNEGINISQKAFRQTSMRCTEFWIIDYNPSFTMHWIFDSVIPRPDVGFLRTTFRDNPLVPLAQKLEILSYEPWLPSSYQIVDNTELHYNGELITDKNQPPPHPENVRNGTADVFMWTVYGLGLRGALEGVIFTNVHFIEKHELPGHLAPILTIDFGYTVDPTAPTLYYEDERNIYIELLAYKPMDTPEEISEFLEAMNVPKDILAICDSQDKHIHEQKGVVEMVVGLRKLGWKKARKVRKTMSVMYWLTSMKKKRIHIIKNHLYDKAKTERENYKWKDVNGILINQPIDSFNHMWDSSRYGHMAHNTKVSMTSEWS